MRTLRVVTLNLWGDHAPLAARLDAAAAGLRALEPDVVLLQEVRAGEGLPNTAEQLAARLGAGHVVAYAAGVQAEAGTWGPGSAAGEEGVAILTRHAFGETRVGELPDGRPTERRVLLSARVDAAGAALWCHTTHLHWRLTDGLARERQVVAIDEAVREIAGDAPHVLGGDFNAAPDCDEIRFLCGRHTLAGRRTYWQDAFARCNPGEPGWTWARQNPMTEPLRWLEPDRRVDYLFVSTERRDGRGRVLDARVVLDLPAPDGTWPSDHFGVLAEIAIAA